MAASDPFLPPSTPTDNPVAAPSGATRRTVFLWVVLILMFVAIYAYLGGSYSHGRTPSQGTSWLATVAPVGILSAFFFFVLVRARRANQAFWEGVEPAQLASIDQNPGKARALYLELAKKIPVGSQHASNALCNAAIMSVRLGDFDTARDELIAVERTAALLFRGLVRTYASVELARLFALRGDVERAHAWIASSRSRLERAGGDRILMSSSLRLTEVLVLAREGETQDALRVLERDWHRFTQRADLALALLVRAHLVRTSSGPRDAAASSPFETALRALHADVHYAATEWPELALLETRAAS